MNDLEVRSDIQVFAAYAAAFEVAYLNDDWKVVRECFAEDAVYDVEAGPPFGGSWVGREAIVRHLVDSVNGFDRTYDERRLEALEGPDMRDGAVYIRWAVTYKKAGKPDVRVEGIEEAWIKDDKIVRLKDTMPTAG
jgi:hypothetical protein